jgi:hypothetical protein
MYRIHIVTTGKYHNVNIGYRYCLTKKTIKNLIKDCDNWGCEFLVERFIHIQKDIFAWSEDLPTDVEDLIWEVYNKEEP